MAIAIEPRHVAHIPQQRLLLRACQMARHTHRPQRVTNVHEWQCKAAIAQRGWSVQHIDFLAIREAAAAKKPEYATMALHAGRLELHRSNSTHAGAAEHRDTRPGEGFPQLPQWKTFAFFDRTVYETDACEAAGERRCQCAARGGRKRLDPGWNAVSGERRTGKNAGLLGALVYGFVWQGVADPRRRNVLHAAFPGPGGNGA